MSRFHAEGLSVIVVRTTCMTGITTEYRKARLQSMSVGKRKVRVRAVTVLLLTITIQILSSIVLVEVRLTLGRSSVGLTSFLLSQRTQSVLQLERLSLTTCFLGLVVSQNLPLDISTNVGRSKSRCLPSTLQSNGNRNLLRETKLNKGWCVIHTTTSKGVKLCA